MNIDILITKTILQSIVQQLLHIIVNPLHSAPRPCNTHCNEDCMTSLCDASLVARAKSGDHAAVTQIYEIYGPMLFRFILSRVSDPDLAEDLRAEVFVRMLEGLPSYEDRGWPFSAWLFRIARDRIVDMRRRDRRRPVVQLDQHLPSPGRVEDEAELHVLRDTVDSLIERLTPDQQTVIRMRFKQQLPIETVARHLQRSPAAVKALQARGIQMLGELIGVERPSC